MIALITNLTVFPYTCIFCWNFMLYFCGQYLVVIYIMISNMILTDLNDFFHSY